MKIKLTKNLVLDGKEINEIEVKIEDLTGEDILKVDDELRKIGNPMGFDNVYNQTVLLLLASKATGILMDDLKKLSAPDFLELTFTIRNFLMGLLEPTGAENSEKS